MEVALIIIGFAFISGSYAYTYRSRESDAKGRRELWLAIRSLQDNDIKHLEQRVKDLEGK